MELGKKEWSNFFKKTNILNFFSNPELHDLLNIKCKYFCIKKKNEVVGFFFHIVGENNEIILNDFLIYTGVFFLRQKNLIPVKQNFINFNILEIIGKELIKKYKKIKISFAPEITDLRPFIWCNYEKPIKYKYKFDLKYTSIIHLNKKFNYKMLEDNELYNNMETVRRYSIRQGFKFKACVKPTDDIKKFVDDYYIMMKSQNINCEKDKIKNIIKIINYLKKSKTGELFQVFNDDKVIYNLVYSWDKNKAYYLFGSGDPLIKLSWKATFGHCFVFDYLVKKGIFEVDLEGVNSPNRGWYKESLGGMTVPYYELLYNENP